MRILIVNTLYPPQNKGGAEKSVHLLAKALVQQGCEVTVATSSDKENDYNYQESGVSVYRFRQRNLWQWPFETNTRLRKILWHLVDFYNWRMADAVLSRFSSDNFDIINTNNLTGFSPALLNRTATRLRKPLVHTFRDYSFLCVRGTLYNKGSCPPARCTSCRLATAHKKHASHKISGFIGISDSVLRHHIAHGYVPARRPTAVIPNIFGSHDSTRVWVKRHFSKPSRLGYMGRISHEKGVDQLCEAFRNNTRLNDCVLEIGGALDTPYARSVAEKHQNARIRFVGTVTPSAFLPTLDTLVIPSLWDEPMGRVAIEAVSQGCPILSTSRGGLAETVKSTNAGWTYDGELPDLDLIRSIQVEVDLSEFSPTVVARKHIDFFKTFQSTK